MTAQLVLPSTLADGPQPIDLPRHLHGVADLIELCFAREMDASGLSFIHEMRALGDWSWLLQIATHLGLSQYIWTQGYVWVESGKVIGSVSAQPAPDRPTVWLVANVATHPEHRRRGIARTLMQNTLEYIRDKGGREVILQVDDDNASAFDLYIQLGFAHVATHALWYRSGPGDVPPPTVLGVTLRQRLHREWSEQLSLAARVRPEGLAWNRPLATTDFNPPFWKWLEDLLSGHTVEHWVAVHPNGGLVASLDMNTDPFGYSQWVLLTRPDYLGAIEKLLLSHGLARLGRRASAIRIEHPTTDEPATTALKDLGFQTTRTLRWMQKVISNK